MTGIIWPTNVKIHCHCRIVFLNISSSSSNCRTNTSTRTNWRAPLIRSARLFPLCLTHISPACTSLGFLALSTTPYPHNMWCVCVYYVFADVISLVSRKAEKQQQQLCDNDNHDKILCMRVWKACVFVCITYIRNYDERMKEWTNERAIRILNQIRSANDNIHIILIITYNCVEVKILLRLFFFYLLHYTQN